MQLDLIAQPKAPKGEEFPATRFVCDVARFRMGAMTKGQLRKNWAAGDYAGVRPDYAKWAMEG